MLILQVNITSSVSISLVSSIVGTCMTLNVRPTLRKKICDYYFKTQRFISLFVTLEYRLILRLHKYDIFRPIGCEDCQARRIDYFLVSSSSVWLHITQKAISPDLYKHSCNIYQAFLRNIVHAIYLWKRTVNCLDNLIDVIMVWYVVKLSMCVDKKNKTHEMFLLYCHFG